MGPYIDWPRFMGFSRHVHHCANIIPHSDPEHSDPEYNPEEHDV